MVREWAHTGSCFRANQRALERARRDDAFPLAVVDKVGVEVFRGFDESDAVWVVESGLFLPCLHSVFGGLREDLLFLVEN